MENGDIDNLIKHEARKYGHRVGVNITHGIYNTCADRELGFIEGAKFVLTQNINLSGPGKNEFTYQTDDHDMFEKHTYPKNKPLIKGYYLTSGGRRYYDGNFFRKHKTSIAPCHVQPEYYLINKTGNIK